jgi:hypothetical protein
MNPGPMVAIVVVLTVGLAGPRTADLGVESAGFAWAQSVRPERPIEKAPPPTPRPQVPPPAATPIKPGDSATTPGKPMGPSAPSLVPSLPTPGTGAAAAAALKLEHLSEPEFRALPDSAGIEVDGQPTTKQAFLDRLGQQRALAVAEQQAKVSALKKRFAAKRVQFLARQKAGLNARNARVRAELTRLRATAAASASTAETAAWTPALETIRNEAAELKARAGTASVAEREQIDRRAQDLLQQLERLGR